MIPTRAEELRGSVTKNIKRSMYQRTNLARLKKAIMRQILNLNALNQEIKSYKTLISLNKDEGLCKMLKDMKDSSYLL